MANARRVQDNFVDGTVTDAPLAFNALAFNSAELAALEVVDNTEHAVIVLDPEGAGNGPEIAYVTAHAAGATVATIVRGREGTTGVEHAATTPWIHAPVASDWILKVATAAALPASGGLPYVGMTCLIMDTLRIVMWNGTAWRDVYQDGAWTAYTPAITGGWVKNNGTVAGAYRKIGRDVRAKARFVYGTTSTANDHFGGLVMGNLPVACGGAITEFGVGNFYDASAGLYYPAQVHVDPGSTNVNFRYALIFGGASVFTEPPGDTAPFTFAAGDIIDFSIEYEAAS